MTDQDAVPPGYKRTEVGVIPEGWLVLSLGELGAFMKGKGIKRDDVSNDGLLCIRYGELYTHYNNYVIIPQSRIPEKIAETALPIKKGDLLFAGSGETAEEIGKCVAYLGDQNAFAGGDIVVLRSSGHNSLYLGHLLNHDVVAQQKARYGQGNAVVHISSTNLAKVKVPLSPNKNEQNAIAAALSDADGLIGALDALITKKRDMKQAAMQQLLTGRTRLPGYTHSPKFKKTEIGVIPEEWDVYTLSDVSHVRTGPFGSALHERDYVDFGTPIITVEHLSEYGILHENLPLISDFDKLRLKSYSLLVNDIVFSRVGSVDRNSLVTSSEEGWLFSGRLLRVRISNNIVYPPYVSYYFHSEPFKNRIRGVAVGQTMASLNTKILNDIKVVIPLLSEQHAIAAALSDMDVEIAALERRRDKAKEIKQGMMQQLLTGKVRLLNRGG